MLAAVITQKQTASSSSSSVGILCPTYQQDRIPTDDDDDDDGDDDAVCFGVITAMQYLAAASSINHLINSLDSSVSSDVQRFTVNQK